MGYVFRDGIHACDLNGSLVFLDLPADRYFILGARANGACRRLVFGNVLAPDDDAAIDGLVGRGILVGVPEATRPDLCQPPVAVRRSAYDVDAAYPRGGALSALGRQLVAKAELKFRRLDIILEGLRRRKRQLPPSPARPPISATDLAAAFLAGDRLATAYGQCLTRSIALARAMIAAGIEPELILGVKLRPFEAHCWVQHRDLLVSDDVGTIAPFTPILVV